MLASRGDGRSTREGATMTPCRTNDQDTAARGRRPRRRTLPVLPLVVAIATALVAGGLDSRRVLAAAKKPGGGGVAGWSGTTAISPVCQPDPTRGSQLNDVAVNATGLAIAAWDQYTYATGGPYSIGVAVQSGGRWGAPFTISGVDGFSLSPKVAVGADGTMAVGWVHQDAGLTLQAIQLAVKWPSASTWDVATIAQGPIGGVAITGVVPVGIAANGDVTAAWTLWDGIRHVVQSATRPKGGAWSAPLGLSGPTADGLYLSLAVNARGDAAVAYTLSPYTSYTTGTSAQYVFRSGTSGTWSAPVTVSETLPSSVGYVTSPQVGLDANGLATVVYFASGVEATRQLAGGAWTSPRVVLPPPNPVSSFQSIDLALDQRGNAIVGASIFDATINVDRASAWVAIGDAAGAWGAPQRLTDPTVPVDAYATRVAMAPDTSLVMVAWIDHYHGTVQAATMTAAGGWNIKTVGRGTAFSAFQEVLGLDVGAGNVARAVWKDARSGTQTMAATYGQ
jgi:hypothetical protein